MDLSVLYASLYCIDMFDSLNMVIGCDRRYRCAYAVIELVELLFDLVEAVFVAPRSEELGFAKL